MHEQSLMRNLLKQVEAIRREHEADSVCQVRVELGSLSGVEPLLLVSAFKQLATDKTVAQAELVIDEVGLTVRCESCAQEFEIIDFDFRCRVCHQNVKVVRGDQLQLLSVSLRCNEHVEESVS